MINVMSSIRTPEHGNDVLVLKTNGPKSCNNIRLLLENIMKLVQEDEATVTIFVQDKIGHRSQHMFTTVNS